MPKFILEINLGNEGVQTPYDVAAVIALASFTLKQNGFTGAGCDDPSTRQIRDINGNVVGHYEVV